MKNLIVLYFFVNCRAGLYDYIMNACNPFVGCDIPEPDDYENNFYYDGRPLPKDNLADEETITQQPAEPDQLQDVEIMAQTNQELN